jgi:hypothetical protein
MTETPLNCFPMRMEWEATLPFLIAEPFPAPLIESRSSSSRTMTNLCPSSVMKLAEFAREYSWEVRTQFSQGCIPHATTGRPSALKDLIGLRFGAHPMTQRQAYAVYSRNASGGAWTWSSIMIWGARSSAVCRMWNHRTQGIFTCTRSADSEHARMGERD